jgi:two-component system cell cycle response regulator
MDYVDSNVQAPTEAPPSPCTILVVDDDDLVRTQLVALLTLAGYQVYAASSGAQALSRLGSTPCQIVLTDWEMPDVDGPSLCRTMRLRDSERDTHVMMLTMRSASRDISAALAAGADDYVVKGASAGDLLARIALGRIASRLEHSSRTSGEENRRLPPADSLTGAYDRRFLMKQLPIELERSRRFGRPIAVLKCAIDLAEHFGGRFERAAGNHLVQAFVSLAKTCLREPIDWIAHTGDDEFIIVLPESTLQGASAVAERVRLAFANCCAADPASVTATVGFGVAAVETTEELARALAAELMRAADRSHYANKHGGTGGSRILPPTYIAIAQ